MASTYGYMGYQAVAASTSKQLGSAGGPTTLKGHVIERILVVPASTSPGAITIQDGANTAITVFAGGTSSCVDLKPFVIELEIISQTGPWTIVTGANVSVIATGCFF